MRKNRALARACSRARRLPAVLAAAATGLVTVAALVAPAATTTHEPAAVTEAERAASLQPQDGRFANSADEDASGRTIAVAPPEPVSEALLTVPAYPRAPAERGVAHRRAQGPQVPTYVTRSSRGTWLFPPTVNAGGNS